MCSAGQHTEPVSRETSGQLGHIMFSHVHIHAYTCISQVSRKPLVFIFCFCCVSSACLTYAIQSHCNMPEGWLHSASAWLFLLLLYYKTYWPPRWTVIGSLRFAWSYRSPSWWMCTLVCSVTRISESVGKQMMWHVKCWKVKLRKQEERKGARWWCWCDRKPWIKLPVWESYYLKPKVCSFLNSYLRKARNY